MSNTPAKKYMRQELRPREIREACEVGNPSYVQQKVCEVGSHSYETEEGCEAGTQAARDSGSMGGRKS